MVPFGRGCTPGRNKADIFSAIGIDNDEHATCKILTQCDEAIFSIYLLGFDRDRPFVFKDTYSICKIDVDRSGFIRLDIVPVDLIAHTRL